MKVTCVKLTFPHSSFDIAFCIFSGLAASRLCQRPILVDLNLMQLGVIGWQKSHLGARFNWGHRFSISITLSVLDNMTKCVSVLQGQSRIGTWQKQSCGRPPQAPGRAGGCVDHSTTPSAGWKSGIYTVFHIKMDQESVDWSVIGIICFAICSNQIKLYLYSTFQTWMQHNGFTGKNY